MSTVFSPIPAAPVLSSTARHAVVQPRTFDSARSLAALLLAAAVAALVVLADQLIDAWVDGHLFLGWVALWVVIFAGSVLFASTARRLARRTMVGLDGWSRSLAEARAEVRMWELAKRDPRLKAEFLQAAAGPSVVPAPAVCATQPAGPASVEAPQPLSASVSPAALFQASAPVMRRSSRFVPYV